jgi:hypothetical protein
VRLKPFSAALIALAAIILMALGFYFAVLRPAILPEDLRAIGASSTAIQRIAPGLSSWLRNVFLVMGGYIFSTGVLTLWVAVTRHARGYSTSITVCGDGPIAVFRITICA